MPFMLDTNVLRLLLDQQRQAEFPDAAARIQAVVAEQGICIAELTYYELRRGLQHLALQQRKLKDVALGLRLLGTAEVLPLTGLPRWDLAANHWAQIRRVGVTLDENDYIILFTAIVHGRKLLTGDFKLVSALSSAGPPYAGQAELVDLR